MHDGEPQGSRVEGSLRAADDGGVVRLEATFVADKDAVWSALTDPRRLGEWLGDLEGELRPGERCVPASSPRVGRARAT